MKKPTEKEIANYMKSLDLTREQAIQMWREDEGLDDNEEQNVLDEQAKKVKIQHGASAVDKTKKKERKPRTSYVSEEKKQLFSTIFDILIRNYGENAQVVIENKEISLKIGEKMFKIDIIERRKSKK